MNDTTNDPFLRELVKVLALGAAFASIPLLASMENLQPPWPTAVAYVSAAIILIGALIAREFSADMSRKARRTLLIIAATLTLVGLFSYLYFYSSVVRTLTEIPENRRIILGFACNADTQAIYGDRCPNLTIDDLRRAGYDPEQMFTASSIRAARLVLVASWLLFTAGLVAAVGWAIAGPKPPSQAASPNDK